MSPAKSNKKSKSTKSAARAKPKKAARKSKSVRPAPSKKTAKAAAIKQKAHCIATDPFGGPCQSAPRLPSKYCTIHSYLDR